MKLSDNLNFFTKGSVTYEGYDTRKGTKDLYDEIFGLVGDTYPNLIKCDNYIPNIALNYGEFNQGRALSFSENNRMSYPAALGVEGTILKIDFIATNMDVKYLDNPRQVSPEHYPSMYGPRPLFSRAALVGRSLYISGTASILGHSSVHYQSVIEQYKEAFINVSLLAFKSGVELSSLKYRVFIKNREDIETIRQLFPYKADYFVTRMCREELLIEIDACPDEG